MFAKPPIPGQVKTRLASSLGTKEASDLASAMLHDIWKTVWGCRNARPVLAAACDGQFSIDVSPDARWLQPEGDLGHRIETILRRALALAPAAVALGADSPLVTVAHLEQAIDELDHGAVLGRCPDGGFYLLGVRASPEGWLAGVPWSSTGTAAAVAERLSLQRTRVVELETLPDIDTPADLAELAMSFRDEAVQRQAAATYAFVKRRLAGASF